MISLKFANWKAEYQPRVYEDSGAECYDHEECECEFLYTYDMSEIDYEEYEDEDSLRRAIDENRVWTWGPSGGIYSGVTNPKGDLLVTRKPWAETTIVA